MEAPQEEALELLGKTFEDRTRRRLAREGGCETKGHLAFVLPVSVEEVQLLAGVAERFSVPLVSLGARPSPGLETGSEQGSILVRFDLMRRARLPEDPEESWVETEPGAPWLEVNDDLLARERSLTVTPPAPHGPPWAAGDGWPGVGSFEFGRLRENVLRADVVLAGGKRREVSGEDLPSFVGPGGSVVVSATLRTRRADADIPFAVAFGDAEDLLGVVAGVPLWHLGFLNPEMARAKHLGEEYLLFGAYPGGRVAEVEEGLRGVLEPYRRRSLPAAEAYRAWGERFFPVAPSHLTPNATREFVPLTKLSETLGRAGASPQHIALQGTVSRSGEVLLLTLDTREEGWPQRSRAKPQPSFNVLPPP